MEKISNTINSNSLAGNTYSLNRADLERNDQSTYGSILQAFRRMFATIDYRTLLK